MDSQGKLCVPIKIPRDEMPKIETPNSSLSISSKSRNCHSFREKRSAVNLTTKRLKVAQKTYLLT